MSNGDCVSLTVIMNDCDVGSGSFGVTSLWRHCGRRRPHRPRSRRRRPRRPAASRRPPVPWTWRAAGRRAGAGTAGPPPGRSTSTSGWSWSRRRLRSATVASCCGSSRPPSTNHRHRPRRPTATFLILPVFL